MFPYYNLCAFKTNALYSRFNHLFPSSRIVVKCKLIIINFNNASIKYYIKLLFMFQADSLGCALRAQGFQKGDRLGLWTHNCVGWVVGCVAAARAGLISVSFPPALSFRLSCLSFHTNLNSTLNISSPYKITKPSFV